MSSVAFDCAQSTNNTPLTEQASTASDEQGKIFRSPRSGSHSEVRFLVIIEKMLLINHPKKKASFRRIVLMFAGDERICANGAKLKRFAARSRAKFLENWQRVFWIL